MIHPLFECSQVSKRFAGVQALKSVDFSLHAGSVLGLVGENGAGKSTLMNILGGVIPADDGAMLLAGQRYAPRDPADAAAQGVRIAHQELNLFPNLSLAENLFLDQLPSGPFGMRRAALHRQARFLLDRVGLPHDSRSSVEQLTVGERQLLEIAKTLRDGSKLVIFDEPTTSLTQPEAARLFEIIGQLRRDGVGIVYISHQLDDVLRLADAVLILRDGARQTLAPASSMTVPAMIRQMVGREVDQVFPARTCEPHSEVALDLQHVTRWGVVEDISFQVHRGEIVGLAGMMGSGRTELARLVFGLDPLDAGAIVLNGSPVVHPTPARCRDRGVAFVTEDRRREGLLLGASVDDNILAAAWPRFSHGGWVARLKAGRAAARIAEALRIGGSRRRPVRELSGGNQQKTVFAKWLVGRPHLDALSNPLSRPLTGTGRGALTTQLLILDEPTRGVDVGAKEEIYRIMRRLTDAGTAILLISSEIEELLGLADRIVVLRAGRQVREFARCEFDREQILACALGQVRAS
jgi:ABC-type sugar transport system ATPase subunit